MRIDWCKLIGHKWVPVYIGNGEWKIIMTFCERCYFGHDEAKHFSETNKTKFATYDVKYFLDSHPAKAGEKGGISNG